MMHIVKMVASERPLWQRFILASGHQGPPPNSPLSGVLVVRAVHKRTRKMVDCRFGLVKHPENCKTLGK